MHAASDSEIAAAPNLVVCPGCCRPQFEAESCTSCGAPLIGVLASNAKIHAEGRERILQSYEPHLEASLAKGKSLLLSQRRLEWRETHDGPSLQFPLAQLTSVSLQVRPI